MSSPEDISGKEFRLSIVSGVEGFSVYLNDYRIAGRKPLGGGKTVREFSVRGDDIIAALSTSQEEEVKDE